MGYEPEEYLKEVVKNLESFRISMKDKLNEMKKRIENLEEK